MEWIWLIGGALVILLIYLMLQRWFWLAVFFFSGLAAGFAMLASIIHFQVLAALGFFVLTAICWAIGASVLDGWG